MNLFQVGAKTIDDEKLIVMNIQANNRNEAESIFRINCLKMRNVMIGKVWVVEKSKDFNPDTHFFMPKEILEEDDKKE